MEALGNENEAEAEHDAQPACAAPLLTIASPACCAVHPTLTELQPLIYEGIQALTYNHVGFTTARKTERTAHYRILIEEAPKVSSRYGSAAPPQSCRQQQLVLDWYKNKDVATSKVDHIDQNISPSFFIS